MTQCANCQQPAEVRLYRMPMRGTLRLFCDPCHASLTALGLHWLPAERREVDLPVIHDRRQTRRPAWMDRLTARDETGRAVA